jgi:hypothetical protein
MASVPKNSRAIEWRRKLYEITSANGRRKANMRELDKNYPAFGFYFRRYVPYAKFGRANPYTLGVGGYFEGDNRGPSTSLKVSSRTYGVVMFNRFGVGHHFAGSDGTHFHPTIGSVVVGMSKVKHTLVEDTLAGPDLFGFKASTAGNNPLIKPSPDIDTFVNMRVDFGSPNKLVITGDVAGDHFPNIEVFILCYRSSRTAMLLDGRTDWGPSTGPMTKLFGAGKSNTIAKLSAALNLDQKGELQTSYTVSSMKL